jgi:hypothetical protein
MMRRLLTFWTVNVTLDAKNNRGYVCTAAVYVSRSFFQQGNICHFTQYSRNNLENVIFLSSIFSSFCVGFVYLGK